MLKGFKSIHIIIFYFVILGIVITGCNQQQKNEPPISKESNQEEIAPDDSPQNEVSTGSTELQSNNDNNNSEQKLEPTAVEFTFYPSGQDFIKSIINEYGKVEITNEMRERFNLFARDYRLIYMPEMKYYESFFEANQYVESFGHNNFGFAVFYVLQYMKCPEKISAEAMQNTIQSLFVAKDSYQDMAHHAFRKLANYETGYYSPCPEGGLNHDRLFYLLTELDILQDESDVFYVTVRAKNYYFEDPAYEPGVNEKWLAEKSKELGASDLQVAAKLIASGEIADELEGRYEYETKIYINLSGEYGYNPRFVSSRSRNIEYDEPFSDK